METKAQASSGGYSAIIGIGLVCAGALIAIIAYFRYRQTETLLRKGTYLYSTRLITLLSIAIFILSVVLIAYLVHTA